jgi:hypothetical protein
MYMTSEDTDGEPPGKACSRDAQRMNGNGRQTKDDVLFFFSAIHAQKCGSDPLGEAEEGTL